MNSGASGGFYPERRPIYRNCQQPEMAMGADWETAPEETVSFTELWPHHWLRLIV